MMTFVLNHSKESIITNTIDRLPTAFVFNFLQLIVRQFSSSSSSKYCALLLRWIQAVFLAHSSYLISIPDLSERLQELYQIIDSRLFVFGRLMKLKGRLNLILNQAENRKRLSNKTTEYEALKITNEDMIDDKFSESENSDENEEFNLKPKDRDEILPPYNISDKPNDNSSSKNISNGIIQINEFETSNEKSGNISDILFSKASKQNNKSNYIENMIECSELENIEHSDIHSEINYKNPSSKSNENSINDKEDSHEFKLDSETPNNKIDEDEIIRNASESSSHSLYESSDETDDSIVSVSKCSESNNKDNINGDLSKSDIETSNKLIKNTTNRLIKNSESKILNSNHSKFDKINATQSSKSESINTVNSEFSESDSSESSNDSSSD